MRIRVKLSAQQTSAIQTTEGAKVLVEGMNKEISYKNNEIEALQASLVDVQNKFDAVRAQKHVLDISNALLTSRLQAFIGLEILKFALSGVGVSAGVNFLTDGKPTYGWLLIGGGVILYAFIALLQRNGKSKSTEQSVDIENDSSPPAN